MRGKDSVSVTTCGCGHDTKRRPGFLSAGSTLASSVARSGPDVDPAVSGVAVDLLELGGRELELVQGSNVLLELGDAAGPDEGRGHDGVAQGPGNGHLGQRLAAPQRGFERPHRLLERSVRIDAM